MAERDDVNPPLAARGMPASPGETRSAAEQAGPASWTDPVAGATVSAGTGGTGPETRRAEVTRKAAEKASELAQGAGAQIQDVVARRKDDAADGLAAVANAVREAARSLRPRDPAGLSRYADTAARQIERASGYLRERDLRGLTREAEDLARRRPELFLAGAVLAGVALARLLKSSSRRPHEDEAAAREADGSFAPGASPYASPDEPLQGYLPSERGMGQI